MSQLELPVADPRQTFLAARHVVRAYIENDFWGMINWGPPGSGKTRYLIKLLATVHGVWETAQDANGNKVTVVYEEGMNWDAWKEWMAHTPEEFITMIKHAHDKGRQQIIGSLDDAGIAAANYSWQEELGRAINQYANVQRRDFASLVFTTPDPTWLLGHVRGMPGGHTARINKWSGNKYQRTIRYARVYEGWKSPDMKKSGVTYQFDDFFKIRMPERVEAEFEPVNRRYAELAIQEVEKAYYKLMEKGKDKEANRLREKMADKAGIKFVADGEKPAA